MATIDQMPDENSRMRVRQAGLDLITSHLTQTNLQPYEVATLLVLCGTALRSNPSKSERVAGFVGLAAILAAHPERDEIAHIIGDIA